MTCQRADEKNQSFTPFNVTDAPIFRRNDGAISGRMSAREKTDSGSFVGI